MKLVGLMIARNEEHEIELALRAALGWCDEVVVLVHASTDRTSEIVVDVGREFNPRVTAVEQQREWWDERNDRQATLELGRAIGGTHFAIIDADEILTWNLQSIIREHIEHVPADAIYTTPLYNLRGGLNHYHDNGIWGNRTVSFAWRDRPGLGWWKDRYHSREPEGLAGDRLKAWRLVPQHRGGVLHLWGACEERLRAKHAWYKLMERKRWPEKPAREIDEQYSLAVYGEKKLPASQWTYKAVDPAWWAGYTPLLETCLDLHREPWQIAAVRDMLTESPTLDVSGLDLFGLGL